jgi:lipoprotein-releasing system permease protein
LNKAEQVKADLIEMLKSQGISRYWKVETYRDFEFTRDLIQQIESDKTLFMLISIIIILVACSNIISMLIILVNDKKIEIGILRSMGASSASIALIFGFCGMVMGLVGSGIGTIAALLTLKNINLLTDLLSTLQGHQAFNKLFYGEQLPHELSYEALGFVMLATALLSLLAGLVPAIKASLMRPSAILRSE